MSKRVKRNNFIRYERQREPLLPVQSFARRLLLAALASVVLLAIWVVIGMLGYHHFTEMTWVDAFLNAAMIVGGMGPVDLLTSDAAKVFAGVYAILSGVIFLGIFGLLAAPIFHRFLHRFHLDAEDEETNGTRSKGA